jgi:hypothetical protein
MKNEHWERIRQGKIIILNAIQPFNTGWFGNILHFFYHFSIQVSHHNLRSASKNCFYQNCCVNYSKIITFYIEFRSSDFIKFEQNNNSFKANFQQMGQTRHFRPLPLELNWEIFECLKLPIQRKFICGLGRGIYKMSRQKVLKKVFYLITTYSWLYLIDHSWSWATKKATAF